jgi:hypothetical protein
MLQAVDVATSEPIGGRSLSSKGCGAGTVFLRSCAGYPTGLEFYAWLPANCTKEIFSGANLIARLQAIASFTLNHTNKKFWIGRRILLQDAEPFSRSFAC